VSWRGWAAFWALGVIWGVPYFFIRIAVQELSPFVVAWSRLTIAALILLPIAWYRGALRPLRTHLAAICAFALIEFVVPFSAISFGERWISSSITGILIAAAPLTVIVMARFLGMDERLGVRRVVGLALGLCGVVALLGFGTVSGPLGWAGVGCMVLATIGYAAGPLVIQRYLHGLDSIGPVAASLSVASLVLLLPAAATWPDRLPSTATLASIAVLGVLCSSIAMLLMFYLVRVAGAARALIITYINPAVAMLLGVGLLHESLGPGGVTAFVVILIGSFLATHQPAAGTAAH
jgi:drug/metabolite transporter (DMT)-like permease